MPFGFQFLPARKNKVRCLAAAILGDISFRLRDHNLPEIRSMLLRAPFAYVIRAGGRSITDSCDFNPFSHMRSRRMGLRFHGGP